MTTVIKHAMIELLLGHSFVKAHLYTNRDELLLYLYPVNRKEKRMKPFVKWVGGKRQLLPELRKHYPFSIYPKITKYAEPFVGGGAVLWDVLSTHPSIKEVYISDMNSELINVYRCIRHHIHPLIAILATMEKEFTSLDKEGRKKYYYQKRDWYNQLHKRQEEDSILQAALFICLNKTGFNGLYRVNQKDEYNVPIGYSKHPVICDTENLYALTKMLQRLTIVSGDYQDSLQFIDENTFVYLDPPYKPLTATAAFTAYTKDGFTDDEQESLAKYVHALDNHGAKFLLSNSDPTNIDPTNTYFDRLYEPYNIDRVQANRMVNSDASKRGKISELLIYNYKLPT